MRPPLLNAFFAPVTSLPGIGARLAPLFDRLLGGPLRPARIIDLLFHLPTGVIDRSRRPRIAQAQPGETVTLKVKVETHLPPMPGRAKAPYRVVVGDDSGDVMLAFFNPVRHRIEAQLPIGATRWISGRLEQFDGYKQMVHPDKVLDEAGLARLAPFEPIYGLTQGLHQGVIARAVAAATQRIPDLPEWHEPGSPALAGLPPFSAALRTLHHPAAPGDVDPLSPAWRRLALDELLAGQLALLLVRRRLKRAMGRARVPDGRIKARILAALPFALTSAQREALAEIEADLAAPQRMLRLLQGDVGSGKTVVALLAMAGVVEAGHQAALMAPTEILARQHAARLQPLAEAAGMRLALLTGRERGSARQTTLAALAAGEIDILIGTHALFQDDVAFADLGLAVVDEQHRFGVQQRLALGRKGEAVDLLVMTATPIPRTLVLTYFGDMDVSALREKPAGRQPIDTRAVPLERLGEVIAGIGRAVAKGAQVYWVCPLVAESEALDVAAAQARFADLSGCFEGQVGLVHGQMKGRDKDAAMARFASGETRILVATTVIEVGVDVPNATVMVIEHAERFGLAQLHQLRGRVGRGADRSTCLLLYREGGQTARARLATLRRTQDGFEIAEEDLKLRGEGDVLGTRQSGLPGFRLALPELHGDLLGLAREEAQRVLKANPTLSGPRGEALALLLYLFEKDEAVRLIRAG
jgi:ATP-dependent DNA helicase RecG